MIKLLSIEFQYLFAIFSNWF